MHHHFTRLAALLAFLALAADPAAAQTRYRIVDLGTLGGSVSQAAAVNDHNDVVGVSLTAFDAGIRGFLYSNGAMRELPTFSDDTYANAINNARLIVGDSKLPGSGDYHGFY